jgi:hypothetical protein
MTNNQTENRMNSPEDEAGRASVPFFARFLEGARADSGTTTNMTLKYPSDRDEDIDPVFGPAPAA